MAGTAVLLLFMVALAVSAFAALPTTSVSWYRVTSYRSIQAAIDSCISHGGGVVYVPPGTYVLPRSEPTLRIYAERSPDSRRRGVTLLGDGPDVCEIQAPPGTRDTMLHVLRDNASIRGLSFTGRDSDTTSVGIVMGDPADHGAHVLRQVTFRDVTVRHGGKWCLQTARPGIVIMSAFENCEFAANGAARTPCGLVSVEPGCTTLHFDHCSFLGFHRTAVRLDGAAGITFTNCVFEGELDNSGPFFHAHRSYDCSIINGWFEDDSLHGMGMARDQWFVQLDQACHGFRLHGTFYRNTAETKAPAKTLQVLGSGPNACMGVVIDNPDISVSTIADTTNFNTIEVQSDDSQVHLMGGVLRDKAAYQRVVIARSHGLR